MKFNQSSLFWKIFLAFWLANILVLVSASYITLQSSENRQRQFHQQQMIERIGEFLIPALENPALYNKKKLKKIRKRIRITDNNGQVLINTLKKSHRLAKNPRIEKHIYKAENGQTYTIEIPVDRASHFLYQHIHRLLILRLIFILIFSGLVSYFLSRFITRPLILLGQQNKSFSEGHFDLTTNMRDNHTHKKNLLSRPDEIGDLARELHAMQSNIRGLMHDKQQLLHDVSHELRAPLARLMAATALIEQKTPEEQPLLERLNHECELMSALIDQILNLSRLNEIAMSSQNIDIQATLNHCLQDCLFEFPDNKIQLNDSPALFLHGDEQYIQMAIMNILRNACQHSGTETGIVINTEKVKDGIKICINDNGKGIAPEQLKHLFKAFYREDQSAGFGLGLNIAQRVIEKMGGNITAKNQSGGGLSVAIFIPTAQ
ncbi:MAG: HAMP domain-containing histidine kinase [Pseudomonadales bacterium]|nr:HAMP domain-containing histidine kinase [Pseudomonadales bacterium]